jgi:serine/threonine protein kinase
MDYIEGDDLGELIKKSEGEGLSQKDVINWSVEILDALHYLHSQNPPIIYRDLKPANIVIRKSDKRAMIVDFGIARTITRSDDTMTVVGTLIFSPEELLQGKAEPRSDIYSLGGTMHCLLTGYIPDSAFSFDPLTEVKPDINPSLEKIIMKALEMDVSDRYKDAGEMKEALLSIEGDMSAQSGNIRSMKEKILSPEVIKDKSPMNSDEDKSELINSQTFRTKTMNISPNIRKIGIMTAIIIGLSIAFSAVIIILFLVILWPENRDKDPGILYNKGNMLLASQDYKGALELYNKVLEEKPDHVEALQGKSMSLLYLKDYNEALKCSDRVLELQPQSVKTLDCKGTILASMGKYNDSIDCYDRGINIDPENPSLWFNKGNTLRIMKRYGEAIKCCDKALNIDPDCYQAWYNKGLVYYDRENYKDGEECFQKALTINPEFNDAQSMLEKVLEK